ncbi:MAG: hypothetical protein ACK5LC_06820 [Coprobacillaceae bacterium]
MEFIIKSPSYYSQHYKMDKEIINLSIDIENYMKTKNYSDVITRIHIYPVVAPSEMLEQGLWKEWVKISKLISLATVFRHIDYEKYINGTVEIRKKSTIKCVLEAVWLIKKKPGTKFDIKQFEQDLLDFVGYSKEELESV